MTENQAQNDQNISTYMWKPTGNCVVLDLGNYVLRTMPPARQLAV